jgi:hypothetical protein
LIIVQRQISIFSAISWWEQITLQWDDNEVCFVLNQPALLDLYSASSLKHQSARRHVTSLGHIIKILNQPLLLLVLNIKILNQPLLLLVLNIKILNQPLLLLVLNIKILNQPFLLLVLNAWYLAEKQQLPII